MVEGWAGGKVGCVAEAGAVGMIAGGLLAAVEMAVGNLVGGVAADEMLAAVEMALVEGAAVEAMELVNW